MTLVRLRDLYTVDAQKIRSRQKKQTMSEYFDEEGYLCFSQEEYDAWKPKKVGRKPVTGEIQKRER